MAYYAFNSCTALFKFSFSWVSSFCVLYASVVSRRFCYSSYWVKFVTSFVFIARISACCCKSNLRSLSTGSSVANVTFAGARFSSFFRPSDRFPWD